MKSAELLNRHTCEIIEDLLPFYVEGHMEPAAASFVAKHLEQCPDCKELLEMMQEDFTEPDPPAGAPTFPIQRKYHLHLAFCSICAAIAAVSILALLL